MVVERILKNCTKIQDPEDFQDCKKKISDIRSSFKATVHLLEDQTQKVKPNTFKTK